MSAIILDGRAVRDALLPELKKSFSELARMPVLAIIQVGDRADSNAYIQAKKNFAAKLSIETRHVKLPETITEKELIVKIWEQNEDDAVKGIIVQLPLPISLDQDAVIEAISPKKDVDALTSPNVKVWLEGREDALLPGTTRGVKELLDHYDISLFGKHAVVVGRSMLVGKPLAALCLNENASLAVCHSKTADLAAETKAADILIVAAGKPGLIGADHVKPGAIVVDVGINTVKGEKLEEEIDGPDMLVGDVDFEAVSPLAAAITPVPGGVGPMTVLGIFENLLDLCLRS